MVALRILLLWWMAGVGGWASAETHLPVVELRIGSSLLRAEVAEKPGDQARGLMFRERLAPDAGMLFVFAEGRRASFWMKNTQLPLSIAYLGRDGTILEIYDLEPFNETPVVSRSEAVWFALEVNRDWFRARGIQPGEKVRGLPTKH
ncbi:MAG: DUF192 domain-containing protein [Verrucomicrobiia bacterium]